MVEPVDKSYKFELTKLLLRLNGMNNKEEKVEKPKEEDVKIFKAKSMTDGDLRMPKSLRAKITWLKPHVDVTFEIVEISNNSVTLKISKTNWNK